MKKRWFYLSAAAGAALTAYGLVGNYFYNMTLNTIKKRKFPPDASNNEIEKTGDAEIIAAWKIANEEFLNKIKFETIDIRSRDGLRLKAHKYENKQIEDNQKWVLIVHGYTSKANDMITYIRNFYEKGYHVLAMDLRGHGESEGKYIGMGWDDSRDLLLWIKRVIDENPFAEITLFGLSMGAAAVMMASGEELPDNVKVIIEDCGYTSVMDEFSYQLKKMYGLPKFPFLYAANTVTRLRAGYSFSHGSAINQIAKCKTPMLFIHGDEDTFVPYEMHDRLYGAAAMEKEKLVINKAKHAEAVLVDPEKYWNTIWEFSSRYISVN